MTSNAAQTTGPGQEELDFALAAAGLGQWSLNLADHTISRTLRHDQIFGYDALLPEWTYDAFLQHVVPGDRAKVDADFRQAVAGGTPWAVECSIRRPDGAVRSIWARALLRRDAAGHAERMLGIIGDNTERRRSEERQAFRGRLAEALRPLSDPAAVQAESSRLLGEYLAANRVAYFEIAGDEYVVERDYSAGVRTLAGRYPVSSFGPALLAALLGGRTVVEADATTEPDRPAQERAEFAAIQVMGHVDVPLVKDGRFVAGMTVHFSNRREWTAQEVALIEETAERTWAAVERVRAETALRQSEERLAFVRRSSGVGFWYCDLPFDELQWDDVVKEHFHLPPDARVTIDTFYERIHPEDREPTRQAIERSIAQHTHYTTDYRTVHPDTGAVKWVRAIGRTFYAPDGMPIRFDGVTLDVTEFNNAQAALRDADRRKDEFLATLAHELRNPLAPIRNGLQLIRMAGADGNIAQVRSMMERQLNHLVRLVDDLLDVSRVTGGKLELRQSTIDLREVIDAAVETSRPVIDDAGHTLSISIAAEPLMLQGDLTRLAQVISNMLNNSAKYMPRGGQIRLSTGREGGMAVVSVADDGIGIPPAMLDKVFEMFTQVDRALEKTTGGLGIGLSLAKGLVEMHGGTIEARSEGEGRGSEFVVRLPLAQPASQEAPAAPAGDHAAAGRRIRVLVADDNVDAAESLGGILEVLGHEVSTAHNGLKAVELAAAMRPDLILLDIAMPALNGYDAARRIRAQPWGQGVVLVALTGWGQEEDRRKSTEAGFDHHVIKPVDISVLMQLLAALPLKAA